MAVPAFQALYPLSGVVEDETKQAVAGVEVTLHYGTTVQRTTTNDLGQFRFDSVPSGGVLLDFDLCHAVEAAGIHQSRPRAVVTYSGQRKLIGGS